MCVIAIRWCAGGLRGRARRDRAAPHALSPTTSLVHLREPSPRRRHARSAGSAAPSRPSASARTTLARGPPSRRGLWGCRRRDRARCWGVPLAITFLSRSGARPSIFLRRARQPGATAPTFLRDPGPAGGIFDLCAFACDLPHIWTGCDGDILGSCRCRWKIGQDDRRRGSCASEMRRHTGENHEDPR